MKKMTLSEFNNNFAVAISGAIPAEGTIASNAAPVFESVDLEKNELHFSYFPKDDTANVWNVVHGGVICTLFDIAMGISARTYAHKKFTPTINIQVSFLRPHILNRKIHITVSVNSCTKHICSLTAYTVQDGNENICATASAGYFVREEAPDVPQQTENR